MTGGATPRAALAVAAAVGLAGCSVVVRPEEAPIRCTATDAGDPCRPLGLACLGGLCVTPTDGGPCTPEPVERCDGMDNDCDGTVDEGHDEDADGYTWCGGGIRALTDCDDADPSVHPGGPGADRPPAPERCDGKDNDCDGTVDEPGTGADALCEGDRLCIARRCVDPADCAAGAPCPPGEHCDLTRSPPACAPGQCSEGSCADPLVCDPVTRACVEPLAPGSACTTDAQCLRGACFPAEALGLAGSPDRFCASACCRDADCGNGELCWAAGTGAKACVSAARLGRSRGSGVGLAACTTGEDCLSGVCDGASCVGNCATSAQCGAAEECGLYGPFDRADRDAFVQLACIAPPGPAAAWEDCGASEDCRSGLCAGILGLNFCTEACATTGDCPPAGLFFDTYCAYDFVPSEAGGRADYVQVCMPRLWAGEGHAGSACEENADCRDEACVSGRCADTCCSDAGCRAGRCRPTPSGSSWEMRCVGEGGG